MEFDSESEKKIEVKNTNSRIKSVRVEVDDFKIWLVN